MSINELFRTQSGEKVKIREPVLNYLDEIILNYHYTAFNELRDEHKRKVTAMLLRSLDRYCEADWLIDHRSAALINERMASFLDTPSLHEICIAAYEPRYTIKRMLWGQMSEPLLHQLSGRAMGYYAGYLDKYIREKAERERVKRIIEQSKQQPDIDI